MKIKNMTAYAVGCLWLFSAAGGSTACGEETVSRSEAIARAIAAAPGLEAGRAEVSARQALIKQAGVKPNPFIDAELENFTGTGPYTGLGRSQLTVSYNQKIERGSKRERRVDIARTDKKLAELIWRKERLDISQLAEKAYVSVLAAKAKLDVAREQQAIAAGVVETYAKRAERGRNSALALQNARLQLSNAKQKAATATLDLERAVTRLTSLWNMPASNVSVDGAELSTVQVLPASMDVNLAATPDMEIWSIRENRAASVVKAEKSKTVQDITFRVGVRYVEDTGDAAAMAGFSLPLAFHDTNAGNISRAKSRLQRSGFETQEALRQLKRNILLQEQKRAAAHAQIGRIKGNILPEAERTVAAALERLEQGAASYLDVYAAQTLKADFQNQLIAEYEAFHMAQVELNRLTAKYDTDGTGAAASARAVSEEE